MPTPEHARLAQSGPNARPTGAKPAFEILGIGHGKDRLTLPIRREDHPGFSTDAIVEFIERVIETEEPKPQIFLMADGKPVMYLPPEHLRDLPVLFQKSPAQKDYFFERLENALGRSDSVVVIGKSTGNKPYLIPRGELQQKSTSDIEKTLAADDRRYPNSSLWEDESTKDASLEICDVFYPYAVDDEQAAELIDEALENEHMTIICYKRLPSGDMIEIDNLMPYYVDGKGAAEKIAALNHHMQIADEIIIRGISVLR